jgi:hypothetical protein
LLSLAVAAAANDLGWLDLVWPGLSLWYPFAALTLALFAIARLFAEHPPTRMPRELSRLRREVGNHLSDSKVRGWLTDKRDKAKGRRDQAKEDKRRKGLPPPPDGYFVDPDPMGPMPPAPPGPAADVLDVQEVHPQPGVVAEAAPSGDPLATTRSPL